MSSEEIASENWPKFLNRHLDRILNLLALIAAVIAVGLSSNANRIALEQVPARVVILGIAYDGGAYGNFSESSQATCVFNISVANLGQRRDEILGYEAFVYYRDNLVHLENLDSRTSYAVTVEDIAPAITNLQSVIVQYDAPTPFVLHMEEKGARYWRELPIPLEVGETVDIPFTVVLDYDEELIQLDSPIHLDPRSDRQSLELLQGRFPMNIAFSFRLASGESVTSPNEECWYVRDST